MWRRFYFRLGGPVGNNIFSLHSGEIQAHGRCMICVDTEYFESAGRCSVVIVCRRGSRTHLRRNDQSLVNLGAFQAIFTASSMSIAYVYSQLYACRQHSSLSLSICSKRLLVLLTSMIKPSSALQQLLDSKHYSLTSVPAYFRPAFAQLHHPNLPCAEARALQAHHDRHMFPQSVKMYT